MSVKAAIRNLRKDSTYSGMSIRSMPVGRDRKEKLLMPQKLRTEMAAARVVVR